MAEYCLRWNNHQPNLVSVFSELLTSEVLVDVTLATDGHFIHAHKLVLSACSAYFKDLFGSNPCKHPIVFLKDIRIEDLKTVIDFIYRGEVNVAQDRLKDVLKTAESLKIKGLADKPFNYDEYSSQTRAPHLSSSFSSQHSSSLTDSREQDGDDAESAATPPTKKRKITDADGGDATADDQSEADGSVAQDEVTLDKTTTESGDTNSELSKAGLATTTVEKILIKGENESGGEDTLPHYESRKSDLLHEIGDDSGNGISRTESTGSASSTSLQQPGNMEWPLSLGHWWASVLPALAQHHQRTEASQSPLLGNSTYLSTPRTPRLPLSHSIGLGPRPPDTILSAIRPGIKMEAGSCSNSSTRREGSPSWRDPVHSVAMGVGGGIDQLSLVSILGKEVSPQMLQALQAVAARRESFSSAAKLFSVSVTTLWRYYRKLGLHDNNPKLKQSPC